METSMGLLRDWLLLCLAMVVSYWVTNLIVGGFVIQAETAGEVFRVACGIGLFGLLNATVGAAIKWTLTPLRCLTFGIATLLINGALLYWAGTWGLGFSFESFWVAVVASIVLSIAHGVLKWFKGDGKDEE